MERHPRPNLTIPKPLSRPLRRRHLCLRFPGIRPQRIERFRRAALFGDRQNRFQRIFRKHIRAGLANEPAEAQMEVPFGRRDLSLQSLFLVFEAREFALRIGFFFGVSSAPCSSLQS